MKISDKIIHTEMEASRCRLARLRCLQQCIKCFKENKALPPEICYVPKEKEYKVLPKCNEVSLYEEPKLHQNASRVVCLTSSTTSSSVDVKKTKSLPSVVVAGEEICNADGKWAAVCKIKGLEGKPLFSNTENEKKVWILLYSARKSDEDIPAIVTDSQQIQPSEVKSIKDKIYGKKPTQIDSWEGVIDHKYALHLGEKYKIAEPCKEAVEKLQRIPVKWSLDHDEDLAIFLTSHIETYNENLGSIKQYVEDITVSSFCEEDGAEHLTDGDQETFWESDGNQGEHWIRLKMKKGTNIQKLLVTIDGDDDNYMPYKIRVLGGEIDAMKKINEITLDSPPDGLGDVCVLEDQNDHYPVIEVRIVECKDDGIDTRIHGIKIMSSKERDLGLSRDLFTPENLVRFPKLEGYTQDELYRRALLLKRFVILLDSVLPYIVPAWDYSTGSFSSLESVRQLLPLSKKRMNLIETFLRESLTCRPSRMPKLYISRRAASDHRSDPTLDPECKNTVFNQIYEGLIPREKNDSCLDYRWPAKYDQWWECKFLSEGIIDQGGGFRDSLSDLADELCPSSNDVPVPLPFFIRSPNQSNGGLNVNKDTYIPNPSCKEFPKFNWIGKIMGACLRGKENLVLSLPPFVWKKMSGERVTWSRDFVTVDEAEVKMIENMSNMDEVSFDTYFGSERTWTTVLSDGTMVSLKPDGAEIPVQFHERLEYIKLVQETRLNESNGQIESMRKGLLQVVPQAVLDLLTWQELERKICGNPNITVEDLRRTTHFEDIEETDSRVVYMWEAINNFSVEDRSRFLRFVTGRRRLPAPIVVCPGKEDAKDTLPESSTCANTLYLPKYSSAKAAEEKLRYAAYNCIAIDTDMSPWDE